ncbi:hypothetical protein EON83_17215 [bacterium]|nr:MAG: hypothetical protein EON83_17215 [bacterium]
MKLTDFLEDIGRPVAYYPALARALGGVKQAVFLCQLIYWDGKGANSEGWIYKTVEEWEEETGLSYEEQRAARNTLKGLGVLEEWYQRLDHRMNYRINRGTLNQIWEGRFSPSGQSPSPDMGKTQMGKWGNPISGDGKSPTRYTENTGRDYQQRDLPLEEEGLGGSSSASRPLPKGNSQIYPQKHEDFPDSDQFDPFKDDGPPAGYKFGGGR